MLIPEYWHKFRAKVLLKTFNRIWWRWMPGAVIKVIWPTGNIVVDHNHPLWQDMGGAVWVDLGFSSDPNDHYRPWLEKHVGKQGWDWDWCLTDSDIHENCLTIKFRRGKTDWAPVAALRWS